MKISGKRVLGAAILMAAVSPVLYSMVHALGILGMLRLVATIVVVVGAVGLGFKLLIEG